MPSKTVRPAFYAGFVLTALLLTLDAFETLRVIGSAMSLCDDSPASMTARSSAYGRPRCRPRIIMAQMTTLAKVLNWPHSEVMTDGCPRESPTLPLEIVVRRSEQDGGDGRVLVVHLLGRNNFEEHGEY